MGVLQLSTLLTVSNQFLITRFRILILLEILFLVRVLEVSTMLIMGVSLIPHALALTRQATTREDSIFPQLSLVLIFSFIRLLTVCSSFKLMIGITLVQIYRYQVISLYRHHQFVLGNVL